MTKTNTLILLATLTCALAASTTPVQAWFQAGTKGGTSNATSGPIAKFPAHVKFIIRNAGTVRAEVNCQSTTATKAEGSWTIQSAVETSKEKPTKEQTQPETKLGPHEAITMTSWGSCTAKLNSAPEVAATFEPCRLQVAQPTKGTKGEGLGSVQTPCVISASGCTVTIDQNATNHNLKSISLVNNTNGVFINITLKGVLYKAPSAICKTAGLSPEGTETQFFTGEEEGNEGIETELQTLV